MARQIETLLFDFGGTLDADGVAWKERFHAHYRAEGLDMTADTFAPAFYASDSPLVGDLPLDADLSKTVHRLTANLEAELVRHNGDAPKHSAEGDRGERVAARFLAEASVAFARNRPMLEALRGRYRLGVVSNFFARRPKRRCSSAIRCAATARAHAALAWASSGSRPATYKPPRCGRPRGRSIILP